MRLLIGVLLAIAQQGFAQTQIPMPVDKGTMTLTITSIHTNNVAGFTVGSTLEGSVRNDTRFTVELFEFELVAFNDAGGDLRICDNYNLGLTCYFFIGQSIQPGESHQLTSAEGRFSPDRPIPKGQRMARVEYRVTKASYRVKYKIDSAPVSNEKFTILPVFNVRGIVLEFRSTSDVIEVLWDQSVYIDETGNASRLIRSNVRLVEKDRPQPNTVIPPGTKLQETVFPIDRIKGNTDGTLYQAGLFPELVENGAAIHNAELIGPLKGKEVKLFLRLLVNDQKRNVTIPFKVVDVDF